MKILSFLGGIILVLVFIIALCKYGPVMLLAPIAIIFILFLLLCGVKLKQLWGKYIDFKILFRGEKYIINPKLIFYFVGKNCQVQIFAL